MEVDIEKEALTIAANTMKRIADEARAEVARLSNDLAVATAQRDALAQKAASSPDAALWTRLKVQKNAPKNTWTSYAVRSSL